MASPGTSNANRFGCLSRRVLLLLSLALIYQPQVEAWPTGAGDCPATKPAVGGSHLTHEDFDETADTDLQDAPQNFTLTLDGTALDLFSAKPVDFTINEPHTLELKAEGPFKGFLIRLGPQPGEAELATDFTSALAPTEGDGLVRVEETYCVASGVGGVTHTSNEDKMSISAVLQMDEPAADLVMDVTVVIVNNSTGSQFYHSIFSLNAVDPANPAPTGSAAFTATTTTFTSIWISGILGLALLGVYNNLP